MDILTPLFSNTGLTGAVLAALFGLILLLVKDRRSEHEQYMEAQKETNKDRRSEHDQYMEMQKETNAVLRDLSNLVRDIKNGNHR